MTQILKDVKQKRHTKMLVLDFSLLCSKFNTVQLLTGLRWLENNIKVQIIE